MKMLRRLWWITIGGALAWFFDPDHGKERREQAKQKVNGFVASADGGGARPGSTEAPRVPTSLADEARDPLHSAAARG